MILIRGGSHVSDTDFKLVGGGSLSVSHSSLSLLFFFLPSLSRAQAGAGARAGLRGGWPGRDTGWAATGGQPGPRTPRDGSAPAEVAWSDGRRWSRRLVFRFMGCTSEAAIARRKGGRRRLAGCLGVRRWGPRWLNTAELTGFPVAIAVVAELESLAKLARAEEKIGHFEALGGFAGDRGSVSPAWRDWKWWLGAQPPAVLESARRREFGTGDGAYAYTTSRGLGMATG